MRSMLLLALVASIFVVAAHAGSFTTYNTANCATAVRTFTPTDACVNFGSSSYEAACGQATVTIKWWDVADCPQTTLPYAQGARAANTTTADTCIALGLVSAKVDCSSGAAMVAVSSMLLAVLAFAANRFTL